MRFSIHIDIDTLAYMVQIIVCQFSAAQPAEDKLIQKFKKTYYRYGKYDLTSQVPYLSQLAHRYKKKYEEYGEWTDCLKVQCEIKFFVFKRVFFLISRYWYSDIVL